MKKRLPQSRRKIVMAADTVCFQQHELRFSPAGDGWCKVSPCGDLLLRGPKVSKAHGGSMPQTPVAEGMKNLLSLKAANSQARGERCFGGVRDRVVVE